MPKRTPLVCSEDLHELLTHIEVATKTWLRRIDNQATDEDVVLATSDLMDVTERVMPAFITEVCRP